MKNQITQALKNTCLLALTCLLPQTALAVDDLAIVKNSWTKLVNAIPKTNFLIEGSYRGKNQVGVEYRLHVIAYAERQNMFLSLMESEKRGVAVLGFVQHSDSDDSYQWKQISVDRELEIIEPRTTQAPMYRIKPRYNKAQRVASFQVVSTNPDVPSDVVTFTHGRSPLMRSAPLNGTYTRQLENGDSWKIDVSSHPTNPKVWALDQIVTIKSGNSNGADKVSTETDLARYQLGVLAIRKTVQEGYESQTAETISMVGVAVTHYDEGIISDTLREQLIMFDVQAKGDPSLATESNALISPAIGQHLFLMEP